ncbi:tetratricopeptide repeat protein (macronuclear) [Tetrahymena thermophila SB210]|uniref:Tetratricopeptide repeat protein n=1 Tax=Tetrahymena thermophila (strain SB210) TaxID=312017 RepID=W7X0B6_TETTS|nr:tetratricopeptide repeat protein [Tetrahymena thermophila SB210]EWS71297.1 tetratricopeptide repeat protein [Tetrahymena thermophila SB210]|eukprot:XP_012656161.1 tetratricopeptide repeat protein [Tetrahymena thermophila SB210]
MVPVQQLHDSQVDPYILKMFARNRILVNCWQKRVLDKLQYYKLNGLDRIIETQNIGLIPCSFKSFLILRYLRQKTLAISDFFETFQYEAIYAITGVNSTLKASHKAPSCKTGNDVRCRYWYALTAQQESVQLYPPSLTYGYSTPSLSSLSCQRIMLFNQTTQSDDLQSVICSGLYFNQTQNYFQNFASSTKQVYFLEPTLVITK